jgi:Fe-S cluster biogenesis protein NfuA
MLKEIEKVLDEYVRPILAKHNGDVKIVNYSNSVLEVRLTGQCSRCHSAENTLESLIEEELKKYFSDIKKVVLNNDVSEDLLNFARKILNKDKENV